MKIWIDLANSPHALLFEPVVRSLREQGHGVELTARDNAQTAELSRARWPEVEVIGGETPSGRTKKLLTLGRRIATLARWARIHRPDVALSHNSYAQIVAARMTGLPVVTAMDYEHQPANHLAFRLADAILMPEAMRPLDLAAQGATVAKTRFYPGLKEELYLGDFTPDPRVPAELGIAPSSKLTVARTPPSRALYHGFDNPMFVEALKLVAADEDSSVVALARHREQREALSTLGLPNLIVPEKAIDSRSLMSRAQLVIGAGGTMTREAALLGIPTYTVFAGRAPAVDAWLERHGRLRRLTDPGELRAPFALSVARPTLEQLRGRGRHLLQHFTAAVAAVPR